MKHNTFKGEYALPLSTKHKYDNSFTDLFLNNRSFFYLMIIKFTCLTVFILNQEIKNILKKVRKD